MGKIKSAIVDSLTFIIPAYNDEATIEIVVKKSIQTATKLKIPYTIIVLNDASSDKTGSILKKIYQKNANLRVITHTRNAGYGQTIKELYQNALSAWLFSIPGDYQIEPSELTKLWGHRKKADMIIGWRHARHDNPARLRQSRIYNTLLRSMFRLNIHDMNSVRLMKTEIMKKLILTTSSAFVDAELSIRSKRAGFRVIEIPISHRARTGTGAGGGHLKTILPTVKDMVLFWANNP